MWAKAWYLDSQLEWEIISYFFGTLWDKIITKKYGITWSEATRAKTTSPTNVIVGNKTSRWRRRKIESMLKCTFSIARICWSAWKWCNMGDCICWLTELASQVRLAHVIVKYCKTPIIDRYKVGLVKGLPTLERYWEKTIGVDIDLQSNGWAQVRTSWA